MEGNTVKQQQEAKIVELRAKLKAPGTVSGKPLIHKLGDKVYKVLGDVATVHESGMVAFRNAQIATLERLVNEQK